MDNITLSPEVAAAPAVLATSLEREHVADIVDVLNSRPQDDAAAVLMRLPLERVIEVFDQPGLDDPAALMALLPLDRAGLVLTGMSADRVSYLFRRMDESQRAVLLARLGPETRGSLQWLLSFPPQTAAAS